MRMMRKIGFFSLLVAAALFTQDAAATLTSSYHDGYTFYDEDGLYLRIDFAVYDTLHTEYGDEYLDNDIEIPGTGQYIYAYQIFSHPSIGEEVVAHFAILDIDGNPIDETLMNSTGAQDDGDGGIAPMPIASETQGVWKWNFEGGYISQGEHSYLLVLSSSQDWVKGSYEIDIPEEGDFPVPIPEPAMITLLGIGGVLTICARRRKSV
ncbi:MAG: PEP-CTERM sorting domain-containing protein [Planctomycetota bacterium]